MDETPYIHFTVNFRNSTPYLRCTVKVMKKHHICTSVGFGHVIKIFSLIFYKYIKYEKQQENIMYS